LEYEGKGPKFSFDNESNFLLIEGSVNQTAFVYAGLYDRNARVL